MQLAGEKLGLPVILAATGEKLGKVTDFFLNWQRCCLAGIVIDGQQVLYPADGCSLVQAASLGEAAVMIKRHHMICTADTVIAWMSFQRLCQRKIYTDGGQLLGWLDDLTFDAASGEITGYVLSDSHIMDWLAGRYYFPLPIAQAMAEERIIVPANVVGGLQPLETVGG